MTELKEQAMALIEELRINDNIDYADYCTLFDALDDIETIKDHDSVVEEIWNSFADVPMNPDTECMEAGFLHFPSGTPREDIWHWFDERHSKGISYLLYECGVA